jgi:hypothetical protein
MHELGGSNTAPTQFANVQVAKKVDSMGDTWQRLANREK